MSITKLYSEKMLKIYRLISLFCFIVLSLAEVEHYFNFNDLPVILNLINILNLLLFMLMFFMPQRFGLMSISSLSYAVSILIDSYIQDSPMGFFMYILTIAFLFARGFYRKQRKIKVVFSIVLFLILFLSEIRLGPIQDFIISVVNLLGYSLVLVLIVFFLNQAFQLERRNNSSKRKTLDLSQFQDLTERDKEWLKMVLQETKYEVIAKQYNMSLGSVRNRFHQIYKIIEVSDRIGFMATYGGYELI